MDAIERLVPSFTLTEFFRSLDKCLKTRFFTGDLSGCVPVLKNVSFEAHDVSCRPMHTCLSRLLYAAQKYYEATSLQSAIKNDIDF